MTHTHTQNQMTAALLLCTCQNNISVWAPETLTSAQARMTASFSMEEALSVDSCQNNTTLETLTSAQARMTASFSMVEALSLYSWVRALPVLSLASDETSSWWTRRRSFKSRATPLPIHLLQTCAGQQTWLQVADMNRTSCRSEKDQ